MSEGQKRRFANDAERKKMSEAMKGNTIRKGKVLSEETKQKMRDSQNRRHAEGALKTKLMMLTGCSNDQYLLAFARYNNNKRRGVAGFTLEQEIARSMETDNGKIIMDENRKQDHRSIQVNGEVPLTEAPAAPDSPIRIVMVFPAEAPAEEDPLPCDSELVDEAFMFQVRKSLVSLHAKIKINRNTAWVDELD
jgi:hypothetical protein